MRQRLSAVVALRYARAAGSRALDQAATIDEPIEAEAPAPPPRRIAYRHRLPTRVWHWVNALTVFVMLMSGLMIFNAHPRLYWGQFGANFDRPWLMVGSTPTTGYVQFGTHKLNTTGVIGRWKDQDGVQQTRAFPWWATIPSRYSLADARIWHLAFAWVLALGLIAFLVTSLINRHVQRDLAPSADELRPTHILHDIGQHARLRFPTGDAALRYNILQKFAYVSVIFVFLPLIILTGLTMSPSMDAAWPWLVELFGGRQSARSIHFLCAMALLGFILVHLTMVVLAGPLNEVGSMITGRFRVPPDRSEP